MLGLLINGVAGIGATVAVLLANRTLFSRGRPESRPSALEAAFYLIGLASLGIGWYFNVRYQYHYGHRASWVDYTKRLFANYAADSAAQDYIIANVLLFPLWTITDGRRRGIARPWLYFVVSLFTSFAFAMALYLATVQRRSRYPTESSTSGSSTARSSAAARDEPTGTRWSRARAARHPVRTP